MNDLSDYPIHLGSVDPPPPVPPPKPIGLWIALALLIAAAGAAGYVAFFAGRSDVRSTTTTAKRPARPPQAEPRAPLGGQADMIEVPPLDRTDPLVRRLVEALSQHPSVVAWLATNDLIRTFAVSVVNVADGVTPTRHLPSLRPKAPFRAIDSGRDEVVDPKSYDRYGAIAAAVTSIDPAGASRLYATLKPRLNEAYRELGFPNQSFDDVLERAIVMLLETPTVNGPVRLRHKGIGYRYEDPRLEQLTAAQKQLLRMGPRNAQLVKERLRAIAIALGISDQTLPR